MKTVELDEDVYQFIAGRTKEIGESASSILRRLLMVRSDNTSVATGLPQPVHELSELLREPVFSTSTTAVARMLRIFKMAHDQRRKEFAKVLEIQGRNRAYFANSKQDILKSGKSTQPREIYGTGYWVMTNSPTPQKRQMVHDVLTILNYSKDSIEAAVAVIQ